MRRVENKQPRRQATKGFRAANQRLLLCGMAFPDSSLPAPVRRVVRDQSSRRAMSCIARRHYTASKPLQHPLLSGLRSSGAAVCPRMRRCGQPAFFGTARSKPGSLCTTSLQRDRGEPGIATLRLNLRSIGSIGAIVESSAGFRPRTFSNARLSFLGDRDETRDRHLAFESQVDWFDRATAEAGVAAKRFDRAHGVGVALAPAQYQGPFRFLRRLSCEDQSAAATKRLERGRYYLG